MDKFDVVECRIVPFLEPALNEITRIQVFFFFFFNYYSFKKFIFPFFLILALSVFPGFLINQTRHLSVSFFCTSI